MNAQLEQNQDTQEVRCGSASNSAKLLSAAVAQNIETPYVLKKNGMYYAHNNCGYVSSVLLAELYTEGCAKAQAEQCKEIQAIPIDEILTGPDEVDQYLVRMEAMRDFIKSIGR